MQALTARSHGGDSADVLAQEIVCDFDMRAVLTELHAYLELDGAAFTMCKHAALETLLNLLGSTASHTSAAAVDPAPNIFDGLKIRELSVLNPVDVPGTRFSMASVDMTTQVQGGGSQRWHNAPQVPACILLWRRSLPVSHQRELLLTAFFAVLLFRL